MPQLRPNDLLDVVLPYLSIDEFEPKTGTSTDIIVVALYCAREEAANDLKDFIETGRFQVIDVEKSDVPDEKNRFLVFVEIRRDSSFIVSLLEAVRDIENIVGEMRWVFSSVNSDGVRPLTPETLKNNVILDRKQYAAMEAARERKRKIKDHIEAVKKHVGEFVIRSNISDVEYTFRGGTRRIRFFYTDQDFDGHFDYKFHALKTQKELSSELEGIQSREGSLPASIVRPLAILFGESYRIHNVENIIFVVPKFKSDFVLLLGV